MLSPQNSQEDFEKLKKSFENINIEKTKSIDNIEFELAERVLTIRQAIFSENEEINVECALGKICASPTVSCPPAIPIAVSGEKITEKQKQDYHTHKEGAYYTKSRAYKLVLPPSVF